MSEYGIVVLGATATKGDRHALVMLPSKRSRQFDIRASDSLDRACTENTVAETRDGFTERDEVSETHREVGKRRIPETAIRYGSQRREFARLAVAGVVHHTAAWIAQVGSQVSAVNSERIENHRAEQLPQRPASQA